MNILSENAFYVCEKNQLVEFISSQKKKMFLGDKPILLVGDQSKSHKHYVTEKVEIVKPPEEVIPPENDEVIDNKDENLDEGIEQPEEIIPAPEPEPPQYEIIETSKDIISTIVGGSSKMFLGDKPVALTTSKLDNCDKNIIEENNFFVYK